MPAVRTVFPLLSTKARFPPVTGAPLYFTSPRRVPLPEPQAEKRQTATRERQSAERIRAVFREKTFFILCLLRLSAPSGSLATEEGEPKEQHEAAPLLGRLPRIS